MRSDGENFMCTTNQILPFKLLELNWRHTERPLSKCTDRSISQFEHTGVGVEEIDTCLLHIQPILLQDEISQRIQSMATR